MEKCPYFLYCNYSDIIACKKNYESCIIYQRKTMLEKKEVKRVSIYFDKSETLEGQIFLKIKGNEKF